MKFKKFLCVFLSSLLLFSLCACNKKATNATNEIQITYWNSGVGINWINNMANAFMAKHPEYVVKIDPTTERELGGGSNLNLGAKLNTTDLYIGSKRRQIAEYKQYLEPLNGLLDSTIFDENVTIRDKIKTDFLISGNYKDVQYALPWVDLPTSLAYNKTVFDSMGYNVPRTSNELVKLANQILSDANHDKIKVDGKSLTDLRGNKIKPAPFIHYYGYWHYFISTLIGQYDGLETFINSDICAWKDPDTNEVFYPSINACLTQGRLETLKVMEQLLSPDGNVYYRSASLDHTSSQTFFLEGYALMIPDGAWLLNEMRDSDSKYAIAMMRPPVISELGNQLKITERQLCEAISYSDSGDWSKDNKQTFDNHGYDKKTIDDLIAKTEHEDIYGNKITGEDVLDIVNERRHYIYNAGGDHHAFIPSYSNNKEGAKEFLRFMYSDEGLKIFFDTTGISGGANFNDKSKIDVNSQNIFSQTIYDLSYDSINLVSDEKGFFTDNNLITAANHNDYVLCLTAKGKDRKTSSQIWQEDKQYLLDKWDNACSLANIDVNTSQKEIKVKYF